jgi:hypothetical protein
MSHPYSSDPIRVARELAREGWQREIERLAKRENEAAGRKAKGRVWKPE